MKRLLFFSLGPHFIATEIPVQEYYRWLSKEFEGEIFAVVSRKEFRKYSLGNFRLVGLYLPNWIRERTMLRNLAYAVFVISYGTIRHYFCKRFAAVVCKEPLVSGVLAVLLAKICGIKSIIELNGNYRSSFVENSRVTSLGERIRHAYVSFVIPWVARNADGIKLLYRKQSEMLRLSEGSKRIFVFSNFVPISQCHPGNEGSGYILFCGYPWHLKGVDILIRAFQQISSEFPDISLKVVGYCPDRTEFELLANGNPRIEFHGPVWHKDVVRLMRECDVFVLPSRTEAMGRVLLEAMACQRPIVASNVDGIPAVIENGRNGLLFESQNVGDLARQLRVLLSNKPLAQQLAREGHRIVHERLSEQCYLKAFASMVDQVLAVSSGCDHGAAISQGSSLNR